MNLTFSDILDHVLVYSGDDATKSATMRHKAAVQAAYITAPTKHEWMYLWALGRVQTDGALGTNVDASTLAYTVSTNTVTLTGATWPGWAEDGYLIINNVPYQIDSVIDSTHLSLEAATKPLEDVPALTSYFLLRDQYPVPPDLLAIDEVVVNEVGAVLEYMHPRNWASQRRTMTGPGQPWMFSLIGDKDRIGGMKMVLWPPPDGGYNVDFIYRRKMRPLVYAEERAGLVSLAHAATSVTGVGTNFRAGMAGSMIRFSADALEYPTGDRGMTPADFETRIATVTSTTTLTVEDAPGPTYSGVKYTISDPIDIDLAVMGEYMLRECERQFRTLTRMGSPERLNEEATYMMALTQAMESDNRSSGRSAALRKQTRRSGFIHYPIQFTGG